MTLLYIALGGAVGALARYGLAGWVHAQSGGTFPWGTFWVNLSGCFLLGLALGVLEATVAPPRVRELVAIGILGAFTTFSTFSWEAVALLRAGEWARAGGYLGGSVLLGLLGVLGGLALAGAFLRLRV